MPFWSARSRNWSSCPLNLAKQTQHCTRCIFVVGPFKIILLTHWSQPYETLSDSLVQVYLLIFLPQALPPLVMLNQFSPSLMHLLIRGFYIFNFFLAIVLARNNSWSVVYMYLHMIVVLEIIAPSMLTPFQVRLHNAQNESRLLLLQKQANLLLAYLQLSIALSQLLKLS